MESVVRTVSFVTTEGKQMATRSAVRIQHDFSQHDFSQHDLSILVYPKCSACEILSLCCFRLDQIESVGDAEAVS